MRSIKKFLDLNRPILITGETGTGKSHLAKKIFRHSNIFKEKFVTLHLASIKDELIESELFGHKKGAFTGAVENKIGYFKAAENGTLFLDEVGELSLETQKKLLYVLEEGEFVQVGDTSINKINCRIILATNKDLKKMVEENKFREDLYFRINQFVIQLVPLREKPNKVEIFQKMLDDASSTVGKKYYYSDQVMHFLCHYDFKGNYRELKNLIEYLVHFSEKEEIDISDLPENVQFHLVEKTNYKKMISYQEALKNFESNYLESMLKLNNGKINDTALKIGMSKSALIYKLKSYQIDHYQIKSKFKGLDQLKAA